MRRNRFSDDAVWDLGTSTLLDRTHEFPGKESISRDLTGMLGQLFDPSTFEVEIERILPVDETVVAQVVEHFNTDYFRRVVLE